MGCCCGSAVAKEIRAAAERSRRAGEEVGVPIGGSEETTGSDVGGREEGTSPCTRHHPGKLTAHRQTIFDADTQSTTEFDTGEKRKGGEAAR